MSKAFEALLVTLAYIAALVFIGWIFYLTRNPWTFALLLILPFIQSSKETKL